MSKPQSVRRPLHDYGVTAWCHREIDVGYEQRAVAHWRVLRVAGYAIDLLSLWIVCLLEYASDGGYGDERQKDRKNDRTQANAKSTVKSHDVVHLLHSIQYHPVGGVNTDRTGLRASFLVPFWDLGRYPVSDEWRLAERSHLTGGGQKQRFKEAEMKLGYVVPPLILVGFFLVGLLAPRQTAGQAVSNDEQDGSVLRTPWGDPDLQGIWVGSTLTPLERPARYEGREFLTAEEIAELESQAVQEDARLLERPAELATSGGSVDWRADGTPGFYNNFWLDGGTAWSSNRRTSLIVDPPNGRVPYTADVRHDRPHGMGPWHSNLDLDTGERCLGDGLPQIWFGYNPNHQIFQTPRHVVIVHEMFNQRRVIPLDGRPTMNIPRWNGEPRGRWEGDTLVVESIDFADRPDNYRWSSTWRRPTSTLHMVERFTRIDAETINYEATIADPLRFTEPWTVRFPLSTDQSERGVAQGELFEFACHEGNYAIANILRGARREEIQEAGKANR